MSELIKVKSTNVGGRPGIAERSPAHPGGEVYVGDGMVVLVARTPEVEKRLANGLLAETTEPETAPMEGYDAMPINAVVEYLGKLGETERVIIRQYEAAHKNRSNVLDQTYEPEQPPFDGYDDLTVAEVLSAKENMDPADWDRLREYEAGHKNRKTILEAE